MQTLSRMVRKHPAGLRLFGLAFLTLYLELAIIRFTSAEILYLGYFTNFVMIAIFLGIGLGFLAARSRYDLFAVLPQLLVVLAAFALLAHVDVLGMRHGLGQLYFFSNVSASRLPLPIGLTFIFGINALIFAGIAQETGRCFARFPALTAYSIDIAGSLAGITVFTFHSYSGASPLYWFALAFGVILLLSLKRGPLNVVLMALGIVLLLVAAAPTHYVRWSPYQRIDVTREGAGLFLTANGIGHQTMQGLADKDTIYYYPYRQVQERRGGKPYENALIIGAGSGTDLGYALHFGVGHVDAVEIDPEIQLAGQLFHPMQPYSAPNVTPIIDDGRAFMAHTDHRYDLIIFALPDSLALLSSFASIRLESFLFTTESFRQARSLLKPDGVVVLYNFYRERWLVNRLGGMLEEVFGHPPMIHMYAEDPGGYLSALAIGPKLSGDRPVAEQTADIPAAATDDWPFLYMRQREFPLVYVWVIALVLAAGAAGVWLIDRKAFSRAKEAVPFFFMGAAFLLLETKSLIQFSLLFGATWLVNALVFFAILVSVLAANWAVARLRGLRPAPVFAALVGSLLVSYALPLSALLAIPAPALRYLVSSIVFFAPVFLANLLFGRLFKDTSHSDETFGWNILGAMVGGTLEYSSVVLGYRALTLVALALYLAAGASLLRRQRRKS